jgi:hypothetical protein
VEVYLHVLFISALDEGEWLATRPGHFTPKERDPGTHCIGGWVAPAFSNILKLCSSLSVGDKVSHPYKTTGKIMVLYILIFMILERRREDNRL